LNSVVSQFIQIRRELRDIQAPGFPYGFRDVVGITTGTPDLVARVYRDIRGITVLYYAKEDVDTTVTVDWEALGFPGKSEESFQVSLKKDEAGYRVLYS